LLLKSGFEIANATISIEIQKDLSLTSYVKGSFQTEIEDGVTLSFESYIGFNENGQLSIQGQMNDIFQNAFHLHSLVSLAQLTMNGLVD